MLDAFDIARVIIRTNGIYREINRIKKTSQRPGRFSDRFVNTYGPGFISKLWDKLLCKKPTDSISLFATVPIESD